MDRKTDTAVTDLLVAFDDAHATGAAAGGLCRLAHPALTRAEVVAMGADLTAALDAGYGLGAEQHRVHWAFRNAFVHAFPRD